MKRVGFISFFIFIILGFGASILLLGNGEVSKAEYLKCSKLTTPQSYLTCMKNESGEDAKAALLRLYEFRDDVEIDSRCHDVAHSYGRELWNREGLGSFDLGLGVLEMCQYGVLHSFIFESASIYSGEEFKDFIKNSVLPKCDEFNRDGNLFVEQCYHGIGHAIINGNNNVSSSYVLDFCGIAPGVGGVESCVRGAVMEMSWSWVEDGSVTDNCAGYNEWDVVCREIVYASYYGENRFDGLDKFCGRSPNDAVGCSIGIGQQLVREINLGTDLEKSFDKCVDITGGAKNHGEVGCIDAFSRSLLQYTGNSDACSLIGKYSEVCARIGEAFRIELLGPKADISRG